MLRIGIIIGLHGRQGETPSWRHIRDQVLVAEAVGFDLAVFEDALLSPADGQPSIGYWESVSVLGAVAATTSRIEIGHSVINAPYRSAGLTAKMAETLDEISGGRFFLGIGLGNTSDYEHFGIPADRRFARFAETIEIVHGLLTDGWIDYVGRYQFARRAELLPRGPRPHGPPIIIAAKGPKMLRLTARFGSGWNWWTAGESDMDTLRSIIAALDDACHEVGRDPATLSRSLDVYSVDPLGRFRGAGKPISGTPQQIAETLDGFAQLGFDEVRLNVSPTDSLDALPRAIEALGEVVEMVHAADAPDRSRLVVSADA